MNLVSKSRCLRLVSVENFVCCPPWLKWGCFTERFPADDIEWGCNPSWTGKSGICELPFWSKASLWPGDTQWCQSSNFKYQKPQSLIFIPSTWQETKRCYHKYRGPYTCWTNNSGIIAFRRLEFSGKIKLPQEIIFKREQSLEIIKRANN